MTERWRRELKRLSRLRPSDELLERARLGPTSPVPESRNASPVVVIVVAFAVFASAGVLTWRAFAHGVTVPAQVWQPGYPSAPASGYYILLPDRAEQMQEPEGFDVRVTALTNLPEGTLVDISTTDEGTCCVPVKDSTITFTTQDGACYGMVGQHPSGTIFDATITARPSFEPWIVPGPMTADEEPKAPEQPPSVLQTLGHDFQDLSGDQVQVQEDGSKWLVATGVVPWPEPRCGGDPIPMFGGQECDPTRFEQQLQGDDLAGAMGWVMGALSQGRMCEFWSVMLPPEVEAQHPWAEFSTEWRTWLLQQDFSDAEPSNDWSAGPLRWVQTGASHAGAERELVDVVHDGQRIATLELQPLPDYCPNCDPNVVPFWGVMSWQLYPSAASSEAPSSPEASGAFATCPDASGAVPVASADAAAARAAAERYLWGPDAAAVLDPVGTANGLEPGSGTGEEIFLGAIVGSQDVMVGPACGPEVAAATYAVTFDDGTDSASLDFTLYVIKRSDGWSVWGAY